MHTRRRFLQRSLATAGVVMVPSLSTYRPAFAGISSPIPWGGGELYSVSDGNLNLPASMILPESISEEEKADFLAQHESGLNMQTPDCNLTLWRQADHLILFDAGAGTQFPIGGGELADSLADAGIDPADITDVVFTHAHPDHLWGIMDDFDELAFVNAQFHMPAAEWEYWSNPDTLSRTPESRKMFVVGAQNRLPLIEERVSLFKGGDEILPGVEVVETHGHTPGHCSFALHDGDESILVVGDALANAVVSFERPRWPSGSDQDPQLGIQTRLGLLDRFAANKGILLGFHLPAPGIGRVERVGKSYRFVPLA